MMHLKNLQILSSMFYKPLHLLDLDDLQRDFLSTFVSPNYKDSILYYPKDGFVFITRSNPIKNCLQQINITLSDISGVAIIAIDAGISIPIHIDEGNYTYSLNIPISGYHNTYTKFYKTNSLPTTAGRETGRLYAKWITEECVEIDCFESNMPYLMNTSIPHSVENKSKRTRIFLLLRIKNSSNSKLMVGAQRIEL